jgi:outer membrane autotransporter protein
MLVTAVTLSLQAATAQDIPGGASAGAFNQVFNVGGAGNRNPSEFIGSIGCGSGHGGVLTSVLNQELGENINDDDLADTDRGAARDLWRFCDNMVNSGGAWTTFAIGVDEEVYQNAGLAPDELFAHFDEAASLTRAQFRSVGSRAKQMRLASLGYTNEAMLAGNGLISTEIGGSSSNSSGLNAAGEDGASPWSIWANVRAMNIDADSTPIEVGSDSDGTGFVLGIDRMFSSSFYAGLSFSVADLDTDFDEIIGVAGGESETDNSAFQFVWSYYPNDRLYLDGVVGVSDLEVENTKLVPAFDMNQPGGAPFAPLDSKTDGSTTFFNLSFGADFRKQAVTISTYGRVEYLDTEIDGFVERSRAADNTLSLTVLDQSNTSTTGTVGTQFSFPHDTASGIWSPYVRLEVVKEFSDQSDTVRGFLTLIPDAQFALAPAETDEEYGFFGFGITGQFFNGWAWFADYDSLFGFDDLDSWQATIGFRKDI